MIPEPSIFTGSATTKIPIIVPPGRGGIAPNLSLVYNSSKKNGWIGVGWDLEVGHIQRNAKYGLNWSADDYVAVFSGMASELVSRQSDWGNNFYGSKIEGAFTKYEKLSTGWQVTTKDGTKYFFGTSANSRLSDPSNSAHIFKWCL